MAKELPPYTTGTQSSGMRRLARPTSTVCTAPSPTLRMGAPRLEAWVPSIHTSASPATGLFFSSSSCASALRLKGFGDGASLCVCCVPPTECTPPSCDPSLLWSASRWGWRMFAGAGGGACSVARVAACKQCPTPVRSHLVPNPPTTLPFYWRSPTASEPMRMVISWSSTSGCACFTTRKVSASPARCSMPPAPGGQVAKLGGVGWGG